MGNIKMITGNGANVSAKDDRAFHSAAISPQNVVFSDVSNAFEVEHISNLTIRVHSGEGLFGGMHIRIPPNEYIDFSFPALETGHAQMHIIYVNYVRDANSDEENISLNVARGNAVNTNKEAVETPDLGNEVLENSYNAKFPLYLVKVYENKIAYVTKQFEVLCSLKNIHPVGSIHLTIVDENPENIFGGKWERFAAGRLLIGVGTGTDGSDSLTVNVEEEMGTYKAKLTTKNLPAHSHNLTTSQGDGYIDMSSYLHGYATGNGFTNQSTTGSTGSGESFSILPPVVGVYMWLRTE